MQNKIAELEKHYNLLFDYMYSNGSIRYGIFLFNDKNIEAEDIEQYRKRLPSLQKAEDKS
jgi:hypothetical protein